MPDGENLYSDRTFPRWNPWEPGLVVDLDANGYQKEASYAPTPLTSLCNISNLRRNEYRNATWHHQQQRGDKHYGEVVTQLSSEIPCMGYAPYIVKWIFNIRQQLYDDVKKYGHTDTRDQTSFCLLKHGMGKLDDPA